MGYVERGGLGLTEELLEHIEQTLAQPHIQVRQRLIEQDSLWLCYQCPSDGLPLLLSARADGPKEYQTLELGTGARCVH